MRRKLKKALLSHYLSEAKTNLPNEPEREKQLVLIMNILSIVYMNEIIYCDTENLGSLYNILASHIDAANDDIGKELSTVVEAVQNNAQPNMDSIIELVLNIK